MTAFTRRRASAAAVVLLLVGGVVWCAQAIRKAERPSGNDLVSYLASSTALYSGSDPYNTGSQFPYIYPLLLATLIRPLAELPPRTVAVLWFMLSSVCLLYVVNAAARCPGRARTFGVLALAGVVAVFGDVIQNELLNGQVNLLVLALVVASVRLANRPHAAPALLGAAIALKSQAHS